jgi:hypothetical protein
VIPAAARDAWRGSPLKEGMTETGRSGLRNGLSIVTGHIPCVSQSRCSVRDFTRIFKRKPGGLTLAQKLRGAEPAEQQLRVGKPEEGLKPGF